MCGGGKISMQLCYSLTKSPHKHKHHLFSGGGEAVGISTTTTPSTFQSGFCSHCMSKQAWEAGGAPSVLGHLRGTLQQRAGRDL